MSSSRPPTKLFWPLFTAAGAAASGAAVWCVKKVLLSRHAHSDQCEAIPLPEALFKNKNFKLVRYKGSVFPDELIRRDVIREVADFPTSCKDVIVASFPKSGTTWVQQLVHLLYLHHCSVQPSPDCSELISRCQDTMESRFPYLEHFYPGLKEIQSRPGFRLIKTHLPFPLLPRSVMHSGAKIIYVYRNPKDVAVSYFHFAQMLTHVNFQGSLSDFVQLFLLDQVPYSPYFEHVEQYAERSQVSPDRVLFLSYEDLHAHPEQCVARIATFLGFQGLDKDVIGQVARLASFDSMKKDPKSNYSHWDDLGLRDKNRSHFFRKGQVGDYRNHLDQDLDRRFDEWIKAYQTSSPHPISFQFDPFEDPEALETKS